MMSWEVESFIKAYDMRLSLLVVMLALLLACKKDETSAYLIPEGYYPHEISYQWVYKMDSTTFDVSAQGVVKKQTISYIRESILDTFTDGTGTLAYIIGRENSPNPDGPWNTAGQDILQITPGGIEKVENNLRFLKLKFPIRTGYTWNGTQYIDTRQKIIIEGEPLELYKNWLSTYLEIDGERRLDNSEYAHVLTLQLADSESKIELREGFEQYAHEVGLIYKEMYILDTQIISELPWDQKAEKGFILRQTLLTFN